MMVLILHLLIVGATAASPWDTLTANIAVVEFHRSNNETISAIAQNLLQYEDVLFTVSKSTKLDMIVFPEDSLRIVPNNSLVLKVGDNPCKGEGDYPTHFVALSCAALKYNTYLLTNVIEQVKCENPQSSTNQHCKKFGNYYYNAAIVFDRKGKFAYRYRKYNLYGEVRLDRPDKPEVTTFKTDFGITFGVFTCFDLLFKSPANNLFSLRLDGIIYQTHWHSELPFLTSLQSQQMFAYAHDVMFFAAGGNTPLDASGGSGIYRGSKDTFGTTLVAKGGTQVLLYRSVKGKVIKIPPKPVDVLGKEMDAFPLSVDDSLQNYQWKAIDPSKNQTQERLCHGNGTQIFCCNFTMSLKATKPQGIFYSYLMVVFSGIRKKISIADAGLEVCGVIACLNASITSCGKRFPKYETVKWPITFTNLTIKGQFEISENKTQFPNSLLGSIRPIDALETEWTNRTFKKNGKDLVLRTFSLRKPQNRLMTFAIFGRNFELDAAVRDKGDLNDHGTSGSTSTSRPGRTTHGTKNKNHSTTTTSPKPGTFGSDKTKTNTTTVSTKNDNSGNSLESTLLLLGISLCLTLALVF